MISKKVNFYFLEIFLYYLKRVKFHLKFQVFFHCEELISWKIAFEKNNSISKIDNLNSKRIYSLQKLYFFFVFLATEHIVVNKTRFDRIKIMKL